MQCRTPDHFWSQFARPFIFVPASFLNDHDSKLGYQPHQGEDDENPRISETLPLPGPATLGLSAFASGLPVPSQTSELPTADNSLAPFVDKSTSRGRLRKARLADTKGVTRAEDIPEYKGQMSVDDLVEFINSGRVGQKDSTKSRTIRNSVTKNDCKKRQHESSETGSKLEVTGSKLEVTGSKLEVTGSKPLEVTGSKPLAVTNGKLSEEINATEEYRKDRKKTDSIGNNGVNPEDAFDLGSEDVAWNDFTVVSRKRKGKTRLNRDCSPNKVNLTFDIKGTGFHRQNSPNEMNLVSEFNEKTRLREENSPNEANLTSQVNQSCPQVERIGSLKGNNQSKSLVCENNSSVRNVQNSSAQNTISSQSREVTATQDHPDKVNPTLIATYLSSKNGSSISSQKLSQDVQIKKKHHSTHQTGGQEFESGVSPKSSIQSLSTKVASYGNSETKGPAARSSNLCPPVVFTDRNRTDFEKLVDISFGFDVQDSESGSESANSIGSATADYSSAINGCGCSQADVTGCTDKKLHNTKSRSFPLIFDCSDENNHAYEVARSSTVRSGTYSDSETKKVVVPCTGLPMKTTIYHDNNGKVEKQKVDSTKAENRTTKSTLQSKACAKENPEKMFSSEKVEAQTVNGIVSSKKNSTVSAKTKRVTNSVSVGVTSADPCATSLSITGRPISVVAPNQMSKLVCSSGQSSCSSSGYGSLSSSGHSESPSLSSVKTECSSQSFCSSLVHSSPSSTILGPCARAPVVKVAPMLVEKLVSNEARDATAKSSTEDTLVQKSNSRCDESTLEGDQRTPCNTEDEEGVHELSLLTEGCEVTKLESGPCEHEHKVHKQEPFSHKPGCNVHKQEQLLYKPDCDFIKQGPCLQITPCSLATDMTGTDVNQGTNFRPLGNAFHLLSAQIYHYKSYLDSLSEPYEVYEKF